MISNYEDIKNEYGYIRHQNLLKYEEKKEKVYAENPELKDMDFEIISAYVKKAKGEKVDIDILRDKRAKYLETHKIPDDYQEVVYTCDKCKDTGFVDGKKCSCYVAKEIECFDKISHFREYIKDDNFANLDEKLYNQDVPMKEGTYKEYMKRVLLHIKEQISHIDEKPYNAIFIGAAGTGKTFLARCIGAELLKKNKSVLYVNVNEYLNSLKPDYDGESLERYAISADLFILDDLGTESVTEFSNSKLNYIIDKRIEDEKSTIITTNHVPTELKQKYLDSMVSRMMCMYTRYILKGDDLRRIKYGK